MDEARVVGVRDPYGFRPLVLGVMPSADGEAWFLASETAALDVLGAEFVRDVEPGEMVVLGEPRRAALGPLRRGPRAAVRVRADLLRAARLVHARPQPVRGSPADGRGAGARGAGRGGPGDARARHRRACRGRLCRGRAASRTARAWSATDTPAGRSSSHRTACASAACTVKLSALREQVRGRRLIVVDDSIVRGTTTRQIVGLLRKAGASEVHVRISAPPIFHPCFYGIDTQIETELIAATKLGRRDPRVHRRRFAVLPVDRRRARRARPAARALLLRLLRRQLPGARAVRRRTTTSSCSSASRWQVVG